MPTATIATTVNTHIAVTTTVMKREVGIRMDLHIGTVPSGGTTILVNIGKHMTMEFNAPMLPTMGSSLSYLRVLIFVIADAEIVAIDCGNRCGTA